MWVALPTVGGGKEEAGMNDAWKTWKPTQIVSEEIRGAREGELVSVEIKLEPSGLHPWSTYFKELPGSTHPPLDRRVKVQFISGGRLHLEIPDDVLEETMRSVRFRVEVANQLYETQDIPEQRAAYEAEVRQSQEDRWRRDAAQKRIDDLDA